VRPFEIGVALPISQFGPERVTPRWINIREMALRAEAMGFDTLWTRDELLWRVEGAAPQGVWDGVSMAGAVAATVPRSRVHAGRPHARPGHARGVRGDGAGPRTHPR
jgi:hypothetical protein